MYHVIYEAEGRDCIMLCQKGWSGFYIARLTCRFFKVHQIFVEYLRFLMHFFKYLNLSEAKCKIYYDANGLQQSQ
jgi:hypothetical protein